MYRAADAKADSDGYSQQNQRHLTILSNLTVSNVDYSIPLFLKLIWNEQKYIGMYAVLE